MAKENVDLLVTDAAEIVTLFDGKGGARTGKRLDEVNIIEKGALAVEKGLIYDVGTSRSLSRKYEAKKHFSAKGRSVIPGFVDPHTHTVFARTREREFEMRLRGASYVEITRAGGGIHSSVGAVRKASKKHLVENGRKHLDDMMRHGTTTVEIKSGYGLTIKDELKMLRAAKELSETHPADVVLTFLGAHEVPVEYRKKKKKYIRVLVEDMIPRVVKEGLAEFCDIFTEGHVYDIDESRIILAAAKRQGLKIKMHADELEPMGGARLAAEMGAVSADHLVKTDARGIKAMKKAGVVPVLLPGTTFSLRGKKYAPARKMIEYGLPVALSTDFNPGTCCCRNMQEIISIACLQMGLTPQEALAASTINAAFAVDRGYVTGSLEVGKWADFVVLETESFLSLPYEIGANLANTVFKRGKIFRN